MSHIRLGKEGAPNKINIGSGKSKLPGYLNIDIDEGTNPDLVADISIEDLVYKEFFEMIGNCDEKVDYYAGTLGVGFYEEILAEDVLEHIPDLVTAMTNCLSLLKVGGVMKITVPYDLSINAWRDPTHVRAFNEDSFLYYTDWFWYMGWIDYRFKLQGGINCHASKYGEELKSTGVDMAQLLRTPRAVDALSVALEKIKTTEKEKEDARRMRNQ